MNQCKKYMDANFGPDDMLELFLTFSHPDDYRLLYISVRKYICQNFCEIPWQALMDIPLPIFKDLMCSHRSYEHDKKIRFDIAEDFSLKWFDHHREEISLECMELVWLRIYLREFCPV